VLSPKQLMDKTAQSQMVGAKWSTPKGRQINPFWFRHIGRIPCFVKISLPMKFYKPMVSVYVILEWHVIAVHITTILKQNLVGDATATKADIIFLLDDSASVGADNFRTALNWITNVTNLFRWCSAFNYIFC